MSPTLAEGKGSNELVACCARQCQAAAAEPLLHGGLVPEDTVVTGTGQGLLSQGPGWGVGVQYGMDWSIMTGWAHSATSNWDFRGSSWQLVFPRTASVYSYFLMLGTEWYKQELFPSYQYNPVPNNIIAIQFVSRGNSTPKTPPHLILKSTTILWKPPQTSPSPTESSLQPWQSNSAAYSLKQYQAHSRCSPSANECCFLATSAHFFSDYTPPPTPVYI